MTTPNADLGTARSPHRPVWFADGDGTTAARAVDARWPGGGDAAAPAGPDA